MDNNVRSEVGREIQQRVLGGRMAEKITVNNVLQGVSLMALLLFGYILDDLRGDIKEMKDYQEKARDATEELKVKTASQGAKITSLQAQIDDLKK